MNRPTIRLETGKDYRAVEELTREAFWNVLDGKNWMYIPSTAADCCDDIPAVEAFDSTFPPKKKMDAQSGRVLYLQSFLGRPININTAGANPLLPCVLFRRNRRIFYMDAVFPSRFIHKNMGRSTTGSSSCMMKLPLTSDCH